ncbi:MAG: DUF2325 domain-containing protein [Burkholderiales bacterium]|nr:DUF2325 domain-containing protein [Burkholderiales bacterium]
MRAPPFSASAVARGVGSAGGLPLLMSHDPEPSAASSPAQRARLEELNPQLHCSIIGTCLTTAELRKHLPRLVDLDRDRATDHEVHHLAVGLASRPGPGAKALHKLLDERHAHTVRRFADADSDEALAGRWRAAVKNGDIAGAYWAIMTHPRTTEALRRSVFGDVHMLSHLVGASNRADIRRLVELERQNGELRERVEAQQLRLTELARDCSRTVALLRTQGAQSASVMPLGTARTPQDDAAELQSLRRTVRAKEEQLALHTQRREEAERAAAAALGEVQRLGAELEHSHEHANSLGEELSALEAQMQRSVQADDAHTLTPALSGKRLLYIGGRPSSSASIRSVAARWGILLTMHDGGLEDRKGLLSAALARADVVLFPVDCVDHQSMTELKRHCTRYGVPYHPLRTASVASFVATVQRLDATGQAQPGAQRTRVSRFCLRHG